MNEEDVSRVGKLILQDDSSDGSESVSVVLENHKSFGRVLINSAPITLQVDTVLPKKEWKIAEADYGTYSHINLKFVSVHLTSEATGILGATQAEDFVFNNVSPLCRTLNH